MTNEKYKKIKLLSNESKVVEFHLKKEDLFYYTRSMEYSVEAGEFILFIGRNSADCLSINFKLID